MKVSMNWKSEKGYTGIDIAVAVVVLFLFVSVIAFLSYGMNSKTKEIELQSEATHLAVEEIESLKNSNFEELDSKVIEKQEMTKKGFYKTIKVEDYADIDAEKTRDLVKRVTVQIRYMFKAKEQQIELSTILTKEI